MQNKLPKIVTREELEQLRKDLETPIDFDELIAAGILKKKSAKRYQVLDWGRIPRHVSVQVTSAGQEYKRDSHGKIIFETIIGFK